jgi:thioredoxin-related protein/tetratricopeptide (TPR) repeat protein
MPAEPEEWMKRFLLPLLVAVLVGLAACQRDATTTWFKGGVEDAQAEAAARDTVVMIEFYTDWCNWCRRLESDTFSAPEVRREMARFVSVRRNAEKEGAALADRFEVDSYPTMVFLDPEGHEMDRILGYLPPDTFVSRVERIRGGDTFLACLRQLEKNPGDVEAIERSVGGLLERSDPEGAIRRIEAFHQATEGNELALCRKLMFAARGELHARVYQRAAKLYRTGWDRSFDVPDTAGTSHLRALLAAGLAGLPDDDQADLLRRARHDDAADLLEIPDLESASSQSLLDVADFAFRNGHYDLAADLYLRWSDSEAEDAQAEVLNDIAWRLYLSGRMLGTAIDIAQRSYKVEPEPETADTLARLLYVTGGVAEAIALEERAARETDGSRSETYIWVAQRMEAGEPLDDQPTFDSYPGKRRRAL